MATLARWDPLRELARWQQQIGRLIAEQPEFGESVGWTPAADVYEDDESYVIRFDLAGVDPKDVEIRFENGVLTIKGERKLEKEEKKENYHRVERSYGAFSRAFTLPGSVDAEKTKAESKNGVLIVTVPKKSEAKPKTIQVRVG